MCVFVCGAPRDSSDLGFMCCQCVTRGDAGWNKNGRLPRTAGALYILHIKVKETLQNNDEA